MIYGKTHIYSCDVTFDLLDPGNAVYHPNYLVLCDRARAEALRQSGYSATELWKDGYALAVRENTSEYFRPATMGNELTLLTATLEATGTSIYVKQEILLKSSVPSLDPGFVNDRPSVDPKTVLYQLKIHLACIRLEGFKASRLPEAIIKALQLPIKLRTQSS